MCKVLYVFSILLSTMVVFALITSCNTGESPQDVTNEYSIANDSTTYTNGGSDENYVNETPNEYEPTPACPPYGNHNQDYYAQPTQEYPSEGYTWKDLCECDTLPDYARENPRVWTIEELGEIIVASGNFWAEWWYTSGRFAFYHLGDWEDTPANIPSIYVELLPSSGFSDLNDIRDYLLQFYTESWINAHLAQDVPAFIEYDGILYTNVGRICGASADWETATHTLIDQVKCHAFVESSLIFWARYWDDELAEFYLHPYEGTRSFTFINGRINSTNRDMFQ